MVPDNSVGVLDMSLLGANYGIGIAHNAPQNVLDVGPTTDFSVDALPTTDNLIGFEDLMMFAINHGNVFEPRGLPATLAYESSVGLERPVLVVNRRDPERSRLREALASAGLSERIEIVDRTPPADRIGHGLYLASAGASNPEASSLLAASSGKALLPEALRVAHLIARAVVRGESRGRA